MRISGTIGILFVFCIAMVLIIGYFKKKKIDVTTKVHGEECYAKVLDCLETGNFAFNKREVKVIALLYSEHENKRRVLEEVVGYNNIESYPKDSYLKVIYYNDDINVKNIIDEREVPSNIKTYLNDDLATKAYDEFKKEQKEKQEEQKLKEEAINRKINKVRGKISTIQMVYTIVGFIGFSILTAYFTEYFKRMFEMFKDFSSNMPMVLVYPGILVLNWVFCILMAIYPPDSKKRTIFGILWFISMGFIMIQGGFVQR
jgi:hypothetical protein